MKFLVGAAGVGVYGSPAWLRRELLERYPKRLRAMLKIARTLSIQDYLRIAKMVCGYAVRLYEETGFPVQMLPPFFTAANPLYVLGIDWVDFMLVSRIGYPLGHLRPYDPRFGIMLAKPTLPYDTPKLFELEGEDLLKALGAIAGSGTLIHIGEDGSELYLLNMLSSERALKNAFGRRSMEQLTDHVFPKLGTELYLYFEGYGAGLYDVVLPPPEYVATFFAAKAIHLDGEFLKPRAEGLPGPLLSLFADRTSVSGRIMKYHIATVPKKIELSDDGTYYDWETGVGVAVY